MRSGSAIGPYCTVNDANTENIPGYYECGGHGSCDSSTGECTCEKGYRGRNCGNTQDKDDIFMRSADGPFFQGTVMKIEALREPSDAFSYLKVVNSGGNIVTRISGSGSMTHKGQIESRGYTSEERGYTSDHAGGDPHFKAIVEGETVFSVGVEGDIETEGLLLAANGTFLATPEGVSALPWRSTLILRSRAMLR